MSELLDKDGLSPKARGWVRRLLKDHVARSCPEVIQEELTAAGLPVQVERVRDEGTWTFPLFSDEFQRRAIELGFEEQTGG